MAGGGSEPESGASGVGATTTASSALTTLGGERCASSSEAVGLRKDLSKRVCWSSRRAVGERASAASASNSEGVKSTAETKESCADCGSANCALQLGRALTLPAPPFEPSPPYPLLPPLSAEALQVASSSAPLFAQTERPCVLEILLKVLAQEARDPSSELHAYLRLHGVEPEAPAEAEGEAVEEPLSGQNQGLPPAGDAPSSKRRRLSAAARSSSTAEGRDASCEPELQGRTADGRAALLEAANSLPCVYIPCEEDVATAEDSVSSTPAETRAPPEDCRFTHVLRQLALAAAAAFEVLDLRPPRQHPERRLNAAPAHGGLDEKKASPQGVAQRSAGPCPAETSREGRATRLSAAATPREGIAASTSFGRTEFPNNATQNSTPTAAPSKSEEAGASGGGGEPALKEKGSAQKEAVFPEGQVLQSVYARAAAPGAPPFRSYEEVYRQWRLFKMKLCPAGFSSSIFFGRSFVFHHLQQNLGQVLKQLRAAAGPALTAPCFLSRLASAIGMRPSLFDAMMRRLRAREVASPESVLPSETGLGFLHRDAGGAREEDLGIIYFCCVTNDRRSFSVQRLIAAKNIFSRQLPKMPRDYIARLVLDRSHFTVCLCKKDTVVGGVCFRPYFQQRFAEIAFLAVTSSEQVKGYGTRLMNHLKEHVKRSGIEYFLTYADNFAVGYFKKQGFSSRISMPRDRWMGFIKDYDGGTLMECRISQKIDYLRLSELLSKQRQAAERCIAECSPKVRMPGLSVWRTQPDRMLQPSEVPGLMEAGFREGGAGGASGGSEKTGGSGGVATSNASSRNQLQEKQRRSLKNHIAALLSLLDRHPSSWPFRKPVSVTEAPDYYEVVKHPVDISSMRRKNKSGGYRTKQELGSDMVRMFENCRLYNSSDTIYYKYADELQQFIWPRYEALPDP